MYSQIAQLTLVQFKQFFREPGIIFWAIIFPILMAWGLGIAFTKKGELTKTIAVVSTNPSEFNDILSAESGDSVIEKKVGSKELGFTTYRFKSTTWDEAILMMKKGQAFLIIKSIKGSIEYHFDPLNPDAQLSYLQLDPLLSGNEAKTSGIVRPMEQTGTRYIDFLVPGLVAMGIMMSCMWGISYNMIDKRIKKLLRRMVATPMKKRNLLGAQFLSRLALGAVEAGLLILFAFLYFDISILGSFMAFILMFLAGHIVFTGIAILMSSRAANTEIANGLINLVVMPMMILSGIFFSYHNFPDFAVSIIKLLPLTLLSDQIRNIFIEGAGVAEVLPSALILSGEGLVFYVAGLKIYKWY